MKKLTFILLLSLTSTWSVAQVQHVGLVFSGGAAKGLAHVGVLKALEENDIPIDFVVGTSMGGIIGGSYAAGMSPKEIEELMLSEEFLSLVNGKLEKGFNYYYSKADDHPSFLKLNLSLDSTLSLQLNNTLANDLSLNFALSEKTAQASAVARNVFDSLFVPLRVVASDIFTQTEVVLNRGVLGDALRATQTVPFFYNPIRFDGKYLFDGGVYNNFPVDVAERVFHPELIIGCNVSSKVYDTYPYKDDERLVSSSLIYMLLDKSDPSSVPASGVYIQPNLRNYSSFDFAKARGLIDSGYAQTMRQMKEIKAKVKMRRPQEEVMRRRAEFKQRTQPLVARSIRFRNFNSRQQIYLNKLFNKGKRPMPLKEVKAGYFRLVSNEYFKNIYPSYVYDTASNQFDFWLSRRPKNRFQVDIGGVIASRNISDIYLGINYFRFNRILNHTQVNFYAGNFYKSAQVKSRLDFSTLGQFYIEPEAIFNGWNFFEGNDIIRKYNSTMLNRMDRKVGVTLGIPLGVNFKASVNGAYVNNLDRYMNTQSFLSTDTLDQLRLTGGRMGLLFSAFTLNRKQYASAGESFQLSFDWFNVEENYTPGSTSLQKKAGEQIRHWVRVRLIAEQYLRTGIYSSGYYLDATFSNQPILSNYFGSVANAPAFQPFQDSRTLMLTNFRAYNYLAGGWRNVFSLRKNLDFRLEGYVFKPFGALASDDQQKAILDQRLEQIHFAGTAGFVLHSTVGPVSCSLNYYDDKNTRFGVLVHVGFLLFNRTSFE